MKRKVLGKGLAALLPEAPPRGTRSGEQGEPMLEVSPERIDPNPNQPRQHIDPDRLRELAQSMKEQGVVQPLVVRRSGARFQIIAGERRWRAAKQAGLVTVPVIVREASDGDLLEIALVENIQREELNPVEEAAAYRRLVTELGYSQEQVATRVGKDRSTVANLLRLLRLPREIRGLIAEQKLSPGHARPLLSLTEPEAQVAIAREIVDKGLSVRDVERKVKAASRPVTESKAPPSDPNTREAETQLERALGTKVHIRRQGKRGRLEIEFHSEDDLNRIYESVLRGARLSKARPQES
jgi:ParB family transcriptional regulator, chromosome partitioning protein